MRTIVAAGSFVGLAVGIAVIVSWIGGLDRGMLNADGEPLVVFSDYRTHVLTEQSIVDELVSLRLETPIRRVSLGRSSLEVDLVFAPGRSNRSSLQSDMMSLVKLAFAQSENVERVYLRVLEANRAERNRPGVLLLALAGRRAEFTGQELQRLRDGERMPDVWMKERMRYTETERWRELGE